jgi:hypothetical protein
MTYRQFYDKFHYLLVSSIGTTWDIQGHDASEQTDFEFIHHSHLISFTENDDGIHHQTPNPVFDYLEEILNFVHPNRLELDIINKELVIYMAIQTQKTVSTINNIPVIYYHRFIHIRQIYNILFNDN